MTVVFHMADDGFNGGSASQLALNSAEDAALLSGDEDAPWVCGFMAAVALVDIGALDLTACELLGALDDGCQGVAIVGVPRERLGMQHELAAGRAGIGADDGCLNADLWTTPALQEESTNG